MASTPTLTFETNFTPPITLNPLSKSQIDSDLILKILQPVISGELPIVGDIRYAPEGEPTGWGRLVFFVVIALALFGAFKLFSSL